MLMRKRLGSEFDEQLDAVPESEDINSPPPVTQSSISRSRPIRRSKRSRHQSDSAEAEEDSDFDPVPESSMVTSTRLQRMVTTTVASRRTPGFDGDEQEEEDEEEDEYLSSSVGAHHSSTRPRKNKRKRIEIGGNSDFPKDFSKYVPPPMNNDGSERDVSLINSRRARKMWTNEEFQALKEGMEEYFRSWEAILADPRFGGALWNRSAVDLKDKARSEYKSRMRKRAPLGIFSIACKSGAEGAHKYQPPPPTARRRIE